MTISADPYGVPWRMRQRESTATGRATVPGPDDPAVLGSPWPFPAAAAIVAAPAIDYVGNLFAADGDGRLYRISPDGSGEQLYDAGAPVATSPALALGDAPDEGQPPGVAAVYLGSGDGVLHCVARDGTVRWSLAPGLSQPTTGVALNSAPAVHDSAAAGTTVYLGCDDGRVFCVAEAAPATPTTAWEYQTGVPVRTSPVLDPAGNTIHVAGGDGRLHSLDAATGQPLYTPITLTTARLHTPVVGESGTVYVAAADGDLHAVDRTGQPLWSLALGTDLYAGPSLGLDDLVLTVAGGSLHGVDPNGALLWSEPLPADRFVHAAVVDGTGTAVLSSSGGALVAVRTDAGLSGSRIGWQLRVSGDPLAAPALDGHGRIFVGAGDGRVHAIDDEPAYRLYVQSDLAGVGNVDIYSLRETYGALDPARTLRVTQGVESDRQPATSLDRRVIGFVSRRATSDDAVIATPVGTRQEVMTPPGGPFSGTSGETSPAFTPIDDRLGTSRPPHLKQYMAVTSDAAGLRRLLFVDLAAAPGSAQAVRTFGAWATALGIPAPLVAQLEPAQVEQSHAAFAPDGLALAWRRADRASGTGQVWMLRRVSSGWQLTPVGPIYPVDPERPDPARDEPCFAPDSRWIAVRETLSIAIHDVFGAQASVYTSPPQAGDEPSHPSWAPDGSEIAVGVRRGTAVDVQVSSGPQFAKYTPLTATGNSDEPSFDFFRQPVPQVVGLDSDRQTPGATVQVRGRGFDILHPDGNFVDFLDARHASRIPARVISARVDPYLGLGVLTVRVPLLAGHGPIRVRTRFGSAASPDFHVLPDPSTIVQRRTVPGALIRVFGRGFDLSPASQHTVRFTGASGGTVTAVAQSGDVFGDREFLVVRVPAGVAATAVVRVENAYGGQDCPVVLGRLAPAVTLRRPASAAALSGLPSYAGQGAAGVPVTVRGAGFPFDPYFGYGTTSALVTADIDPSRQPVPPLVPIEIRTLGFVQSGPDTVDLAGATFAFPGLGPGHPGGVLDIVATDTKLPAAAARTRFQVPETDIPIVVIPGTSGSSLDIAPGVGLASPFTVSMPTHAHWFPWLSKNPTPWPINPLGPLIHFGRDFVYTPTTPNTYPPPGPVFSHPGDARGRRVWMGPEGIAELANTALTGNVGNHYLDACAFDSTGNPVHPEIVPGTVFEDVMAIPPGASGSLSAWGFVDVYKPMLDALRTTVPNKSWPGRPLCRGADPATGVCVDENGNAASGRNAIYLFNLDWRQGIPSESARLATFIDAVRSRPDVAGRKVALITHSYGGPIARAYYLDASNAAGTKVDQVISFGGGFLGVVQPMDILEKGGNWGFGLNLGPIGAGVQTWETRDLAQNWPTAYFQMPNSEAWFADHGPVAGGFVNRAYVRDYRPGGAGDIAPPGVPNPWATSTGWVGARHNVALAVAQTSFFAPPGGAPLPMGDFTAGTGTIFHHRVVGKGRMDTVVATRITLEPSLDAPVYLPLSPEWIAAMVPTESWASVLGDGDSTVPYHGAIGLTDPRDDRVYVLDGAKHGDLPNLPEVIGTPTVRGLLQSLLEGSVGSVSQAPPPFGSQNMPEVRAALAPIAVSGVSGDEREGERADRWLIEVTGLARLDITDREGNHLGPHPRLPGLVEEGIPDAGYRPGPPVTTAYLPSGRYDVRVSAEAAQNLRVLVRRFARTRALSSFLFREVDVEPRDVARLTLTEEAEPVVGAWLSVEPAGGGAPRRVAARVLTPAASEDTMPPRTLARIEDGNLLVDADDGPMGSGVRRTLVTFDGGRFGSYEGPMAVPEDAVVVMAYSEDVAGNREYPGSVAGVLGASRSDLLFRRHELESQDVDIVNMDPLRISEPIPWRVTTAAPWVRFRPEDGRTPRSLRVWIDPDRLPGDGMEVTTEVTIHDEREQPVFATRALLVTVAAAPTPDDTRTDLPTARKLPAGPQ